MHFFRVTKILHLPKNASRRVLVPPTTLINLVQVGSEMSFFGRKTENPIGPNGVTEKDEHEVV